MPQSLAIKTLNHPSVHLAAHNLEVYTKYQQSREKVELYIHKTFSGRKFHLLNEARTDSNFVVKAFRKTARTIKLVWLKVLVLLHLAKRSDAENQKLIAKAKKDLADVGKNNAVRLLTAALGAVENPAAAALQTEDNLLEQNNAGSKQRPNVHVPAQPPINTGHPNTPPGAIHIPSKSGFGQVTIEDDPNDEC